MNRLGCWKVLVLVGLMAGAVVSCSTKNPPASASVVDTAKLPGAAEVKAALEKANSFGLVGMRERVALLGGKSEITSQPGQGTRVSVEIPIWRAQIGKELPANAGKAQRGYGQDSHLSHRRSHALSPRN